jgi:hypothetical protein
MTGCHDLTVFIQHPGNDAAVPMTEVLENSVNLIFKIKAKAKDA